MRGDRPESRSSNGLPVWVPPHIVDEVLKQSAFGVAGPFVCRTEPFDLIQIGGTQHHLRDFFPVAGDFCLAFAPHGRRRKELSGSPLEMSVTVSYRTSEKAPAFPRLSPGFSPVKPRLFPG